MSDKSSLGDRMKRYEDVSRIKLTPRMPLICRLDGKAFHTYTRGFDKPVDEKIINAMSQTAISLSREVQGFKVAYIQSDEISILANDYEGFDTQAWFDKNLQKMVSVLASVATAYFNKYMWSVGVDKTALFDSRAFVIPREEACNYFIWRQQDAVRNSISGYAQANFSSKELHKKSTKDMKQMLDEKGLSWENDVSIKNQRGWCIVRKVQETDGVIRTVICEDTNIPVFSANRDYIDKYLVQVEQ